MPEGYEGIFGNLLSSSLIFEGFKIQNFSKYPKNQTYSPFGNQSKNWAFMKATEVPAKHLCFHIQFSKNLIFNEFLPKTR